MKALRDGIAGDEEARRFYWQIERLNRLELDTHQVDRLIRAGVDWHEVQALLERGCSPELAVEILA